MLASDGVVGRAISCVVLESTQLMEQQESRDSLVQYAQLTSE